MGEINNTISLVLDLKPKLDVNDTNKAVQEINKAVSERNLNDRAAAGLQDAYNAEKAGEGQKVPKLIDKIKSLAAKQDALTDFNAEYFKGYFASNENGKGIVNGYDVSDFASEMSKLLPDGSEIKRTFSMLSNETLAAARKGKSVSNAMSSLAREVKASAEYLANENMYKNTPEESPAALVSQHSYASNKNSSASTKSSAATKENNKTLTPKQMASYESAQMLFNGGRVGTFPIPDDTTQMLQEFKDIYDSLQAEGKSYLDLGLSPDTVIVLNDIKKKIEENKLTAADWGATQSSAIYDMNKALDKYKKKIDSAAQAQEALQKLSVNIFRIRAIIAIVTQLFSKFVGSLKDWFDASSEYAEASHLLYATLSNSIGQTAEATEALANAQKNVIKGTDLFGNTISTTTNYTKDSIIAIETITSKLDALASSKGLDPTSLKRTYATFYEMANAAGLASTEIDKIATGFTQLSYDIGSLYDTDFATVAKDLRSALGGVTTSVRKYGMDISRTAADNWLQAKGIDATYNSLNRASKMMVIYSMAMEHTSTAQGDLAQSIKQPANQLRILNEQMTQAARVMGAALFPLVTPLIGVFISLAKAIQSAATAVYNFLSVLMGSGYKDAAAQWNNFFQSLSSADALSDLSDYADDADDSLKSASGSAKDLQKILMGFDEINNISPESESGGSGAEGLDISSQLASELASPYEWLSNVFDSLLGKLSPLLEIFGAFFSGVGAGFMFVAKAIGDVITLVDNLLGLLLSIPVVREIILGLATAFGTLSGVLIPVALGYEAIRLVLGKLNVPMCSFRDALSRMGTAMIQNTTLTQKLGLEFKETERGLEAVAGKSKIVTGAIGAFGAALGTLAVAVAIEVISRLAQYLAEVAQKAALVQQAITPLSISFDSLTASATSYADTFASCVAASDNLIASQVEMKSELENSWNTMLTSISTVETAIGIMEEYIGKTNLTAQQQAALSSAVQTYNEKTGASIEIIDIQNGLLSEEISTIRENGNAWIDNAIKQAEASIKSELLCKNVELLTQKLANQNKIKELELELDEARHSNYENEANDIIAKIAKLEEENIALDESVRANVESSELVSTAAELAKDKIVACKDEVIDKLNDESTASATSAESISLSEEEIATAVEESKESIRSSLDEEAGIWYDYIENLDASKRDALNTLLGLTNGSTEQLARLASAMNLKTDEMESSWSGMTFNPPRLREFGFKSHLDDNMLTNLMNGLPVEVAFNPYWYASGGIVDEPTLGVFGEAGREAVIPLVGAKMKPFSMAIAADLAKFNMANASNTSQFSNMAGELIQSGDEQTALLKEQNSLLRSLLSKDVSVQLDGVQLAQSINKASRVQGRTLVTI